MPKTSNNVRFEFNDSSNEGGGFEESCADGGFYKSADFWNHIMVKDVGGLKIRPGLNDDTLQVCYYFKHENEKSKPSYVELERRKLPDFLQWTKDIFQQLNSTSPQELIPLLKQNEEHASPEKINNGKVSSKWLKPRTLFMLQINNLFGRTFQRTSLTTRSRSG